MRKQKLLIVVLAVSMVFCSASAQDVTATERSEIIHHVVDQLANRYVDPHLGPEAAETLKQREAQHTYDALESKASLIEALTADIYATTGDKQLQLKDRSAARPEWIHPAITFKLPNGANPNDPRYQKIFLQFVNYGLPNPHVLKGNIGYLFILEFYSPGIAPKVYQVIDKTMQTFQKCTAMILDLRSCSRGGDPEVMMYLASYFLSGEKAQPLYVSFDRENQKFAEFRIRTDIPGKRMSSIPLYILVSSKTFSTGEMFAYGLQKVGRATVIGETSAGAAHVTDTIDIGHGMMMVLPVNSLAHVKTKTHWQGTGVIPDVTVEADRALDVAKDTIQKTKQNDR
jgi:retinol-binding protein 3